MKIRLAEHAGFCFGVRRAVEIAEGAARKYGKVYTFGPLIHNPQEVKRLRELGVEVVQDIDEVKEGIIIIPSHGVDAGIQAKFKEKGLNTVDATCPLVKRTQEVVRTLRKEGYEIVILGDREHTEVRGLLSVAGGKAFVVESREEVDSLPFFERIGLLSQTTQTPHALAQVAEALVPHSYELRVFNTICDATLKRQAAAHALACEVEVMVVVGGYNSANTRRLYEICKNVCPKVYHIEEEGELEPNWFEGVEEVGVTAGASTPSWVIEAVMERMKEIAQ